MIKRSLFVLFIMLVAFGYSQKTIKGSYRIENNQHPEKLAFYMSTIENANMESFRLKDKEVVLKFENGFECTLLSAKQLFIAGIAINPNDYQENFSPVYVLPVFNIRDDGYIMARSFKASKTNRNNIK